MGYHEGCACAQATMNARLGAAGGHLGGAPSPAPAAGAPAQSIAESLSAMMGQPPAAADAAAAPAAAAAAAEAPAAAAEPAAAAPAADVETMGITVRSTRTEQGEAPLEIRVPCDATVGVLKKLVAAAATATWGADHAACDMARQRLVFRGKMLSEEAASVASTGLKAGDSLIVAPRPKQAAGPVAAGAAGDDAAFAAALRTMTATPAPALKTALKTMVTLCKNVMMNPREDKYRRIKTGNKAIQTRVLSVAGAADCLAAMGFAGEAAGELRMADAALRGLPRRINELQSALSALEAPASTAASPFGAPAAAASPFAAPSASPFGVPGAMGGGLGAMGGMGAMGGGMGGMGGMPDAATMASQLQNPQVQAMMTQMGVSPQQAQQALGMMQSNPGMMQQAMSMMRSNPQMAQQAPHSPTRECAPAAARLRLCCRPLLPKRSHRCLPRSSWAAWAAAAAAAAACSAGAGAGAGA